MESGDRSRLRLTLAQLLLLGGAVAIGLSLGVAALVLSVGLRRHALESTRRALEQSVDLVAQSLAGRQRSLSGGARVFVQGPYFRAIVAEGRRDDILDQTFEAASQLDADWVFIVNDRGALVAKSDEPGAAGAEMGGVPLVAGALQGRVMGGFGVSRDSLLFQAVAVPIVPPGGAPVGVLVATRLVDSLLTRDLKSLSNAEIVFYTRGASARPYVATSTLGVRNDRRQVADAVASLVTTRVSTVRVGGVTYAARGGTLATAGGELVGGFAVLSPAGADEAAVGSLWGALGAAGLLSGILLLLGGRWLHHQATVPLQDAATRLRAALEGIDAPGAAASPTRVRDVDTLARTAMELATERIEEQRIARLVWTCLPEPAPAVPSAARRSTRHGTRGAVATLSGGGSLSLEADQPDAILPQPGTLFASRFTILEEVAAAGGTHGYRAHDRSRSVDVTLTVIRAVAGRSPLSLAELRPDLEPVLALRHRNVVPALDVGITGQLAYVTTEHVPGVTLARLARRDAPLDARVLLAILRGIVGALVGAHEKGFVHGAMTSSQCRLRLDGRVLVDGFAAAAAVRRLTPTSGRTAHEPPAIAGAAVGEPAYLAPEQLLGQEGDARADLYACGVMLIEALTGTTPFDVEAPQAFLAQKLSQRRTWRPLPERQQRDDAVRAALSLLAEELTHPEPRDRPWSAREVQEMLPRVD